MLQPIQSKSKNNGFTLLEVLVATTIGLLILGSVSSIYILSSRSYQANLNQSELTQNARISLERISRDLRQTERIVTSIPLIPGDPLNPPPSHLQFQDGHDNSKISYIEYYLNNSNLHRKSTHYYFPAYPDIWVSWNAQDSFGNPPEEVIDEDVIKADKIQSIKFYGNKIITVELTVTDKGKVFEFKTQVLGRNIQ